MHRLMKVHLQSQKAWLSIFQDSAKMPCRLNNRFTNTILLGSFIQKDSIMHRVWENTFFKKKHQYLSSNIGWLPTYLIQIKSLFLFSFKAEDYNSILDKCRDLNPKSIRVNLMRENLIINQQNRVIPQCGLIPGKIRFWRTATSKGDWTLKQKYTLSCHVFMMGKNDFNKANPWKQKSNNNL